MIRLLLVIALMLVARNAWSIDDKGTYTSFYNMGCKEVLKGHSGIERTARGWRADHEGYLLMGWLAGYATHVNKTERDTAHMFDPATRKKWVSAPPNLYVEMDLHDMAAWVASWCRENSSGNIIEAMDKLICVKRNDYIRKQGSLGKGLVFFQSVCD